MTEFGCCRTGMGLIILESKILEQLLWNNLPLSPLVPYHSWRIINDTTTSTIGTKR